jgi:hypothetical protein
MVKQWNVARNISLAGWMMASISFPMPATASTLVGGRVTNLTVARDGFVWFNYEGGSRTGTIPGCAAATGAPMMAINLATPGGAAILAQLLSASARAARVDIAGTGNSCDGMHEAVAYVVAPG